MAAGSKNGDRKLKSLPLGLGTVLGILRDQGHCRSDEVAEESLESQGNVGGAEPYLANILLLVISDHVEKIV